MSTYCVCLLEPNPKQLTPKEISTAEGVKAGQRRELPGRTQKDGSAGECVGLP